MTKQERIDAVAAALESSVIESDSGMIYPYYSRIAAQLVAEGFGNLREFKAEIISLYLKGDITGLLKVLQEEI